MKKMMRKGLLVVAGLIIYGVLAYTWGATSNQLMVDHMEEHYVQAGETYESILKKHNNDYKFDEKTIENFSIMYDKKELEEGVKLAVPVFEETEVK